MKNVVRKLDFYGYDNGYVIKEGTNFSQNPENTNRTISKNGEYRVINRIGK